jgi:molecular chaperone GrpE (heat shock protein)
MENEKFIEDMQQAHEKKKLSYKEMEKALKEYKESLELATQTIKNQITENKENYDKYLRALADYQNLQRNTAFIISKSIETGKIARCKDSLRS